MDKVIDFEETNSEEELIEDELEEIEDEEMTAEERAYYNSITSKMSFDFDSLPTISSKKENKKARKDRKKQRSLKKLEEENEAQKILETKKKTWKSSRAEKHKKADGIVKIEVRKFNPRPLPLDWDEEKGCVKVMLKKKEPEIKVSFPTLGLASKKVTNSKISNAWGKMMKNK